ncbi:MAG: PorP/SprF family type IX secretion system membrane protein [Bacteroidota bacterium]
MRIFKLLLLSIFSCVLSLSHAQDIHFSQFNLSPLTLNPAYTGAFEGSFRIGGIYRDQWRSVIDNQFVTPSFYIDAPIIRGFGKNDWVGVGVSILNDKAGTSELSRLNAMLSLAYHLALGSKANTYISIGAQGGMVQKKITTTALTFADQFQGGQFVGSSADLSNIPDDNISYLDFQAGLVLNSNVTSKFNFYLGYSAHHLTQPEDAFLTNTPNDDKKLSMRHVANGGFNIDFGKRWVFSPTALYQRQASASETDIQALFGYHLKTDKTVTLNFGAGYRLKDAAIARIGMDIKGLKAGIAYDFNTSDLTSASSGRGGFEIALAYIAKIYRTPVVKPVLFCPRF